MLERQRASEKKVRVVEKRRMSDRLVANAQSEWLSSDIGDAM
jgi:hypothetical protein